MGIRSLLFYILYPLPQKGEDLLAHKKKFIEEYISLHQFFTDIKSFFTSQKSKKDFHYQRNNHEQEQRARMMAYRTWQRVVGKRKGEKMRFFDFFKKKRALLSFDGQRAEQDFEKQMQICRDRNERMGETLYDYVQKEIIECHIPKKGCDILTTKESFFACYTFQENYRSTEAVVPENLKQDQQTPAYQKVWSKRWHDYDQRARLVAHKKWREMMSNSR